MYNPYNWKITKTDKAICIIDRLAEIEVELYREEKNQEYLNKKQRKIEKNIIKLEKEKLSLIEKFLDEP